jgi:hypothetical protein
MHEPDPVGFPVFSCHVSNICSAHVSHSTTSLEYGLEMRAAHVRRGMNGDAESTWSDDVVVVSGDDRDTDSPPLSPCSNGVRLRVGCTLTKVYRYSVGLAELHMSHSQPMCNVGKSYSRH